MPPGRLTGCSGHDLSIAIEDTDRLAHKFQSTKNAHFFEERRCMEPLAPAWVSPVRDNHGEDICRSTF